MSLDLNQVARIANLSRLELNEVESQNALDKLNGFFKIAEQLQAIDTKGIAPLSHPIAVIQDVSLRLREDKVTETNQRIALQATAPATEKGLYLVPKVIE